MLEGLTSSSGHTARICQPLHPPLQSGSNAILTDVKHYLTGCHTIFNSTNTVGIA